MAKSKTAKRYKPVVAFIDGDVIAHKASCGVEKSVWLDEDNVTLLANPEDAFEIFDSKVRRIQDALKTRCVIIAFSDKTQPYFRCDIYPDYKANRDKHRKPICIEQLKDFVRTSYTVFELPRLEADDIMGMMGTWPGWKGGKGTLIMCKTGERDVPITTDFVPVIVSIDKDMATLPCRFYNFETGEKSHRTPKEAHYFHMFQTLTGDTTDHYPGCRGVGPKGAKKILDAADGDLWSAVVEAFERSGATEEDALVQARLAYILQYKDYNFETKEIKLWQPPLKKK